jgi:hypothetical protein
LGSATITLGTSTQTVNWDITLSQWTDLVQFGASEVVTTTPANDPLTAAWITEISITVNGTHEVVRQFSREEYITFVQNLEIKEADLISNGNMLWKKFDPPLAPGTRLGVTIVINTLANALTTPASTGVLRCQLLTYDAQQRVYAKQLRLYQRIPVHPAVAGVTAAQPIQIDLGTEAKTIRYLLVRELTAGAPTDTFTGRLDLLFNGNTVARINATSAKTHYNLISDGLNVPAGVYMLKLPGPGWRAENATTLHMQITAHTTASTGQYSGVQVLEKPYT